MTHTIVLDVGKTHVKLNVLDERYAIIFGARCENVVTDVGPYPHFSLEALWAWVLSSIKGLSDEVKALVDAICVTTHGATAALIDAGAEPSKALVLPVLDYEFEGVELVSTEYQLQRPPFTESFSPSLPCGLNLGAQLFWLEKSFPEAFDKASHILMYPQYFAWLFSGELCSEVSSLGCHTDLWDSRNQGFSSFVRNMGWERKFPDIKPAWESIGGLRPYLAKELGLKESCKVHAGVHDSNASFLRYLGREGDITVLSTGTWTIAMSTGCELQSLDSSRDMLANTAVNKQVVACSRFMGGREYELICSQLNGSIDADIDAQQLNALMQTKCFALPNFCPGSGPFPASQAQIVGDVKPEQAAALASLYCALMMDVQLDLLGVDGDIVIEGSFLKNQWLCEIFAALRPQQKVFLSADETGTVLGCAQLAAWDSPRVEPELVLCRPAELMALLHYRVLWHELVELC